MNLLRALETPLPYAALALAAAGVLLALERRGHGVLGGLLSIATLVPLAGLIAFAPRIQTSWSALAAGLVVAILARNRDDLLHSECALKLLWVMGGALALSWAGLELLVLATGTTVELEQWGVLELGLDPRFLWSTALPLSLLAGVVLLATAPFHFWAADLFQGARPWLAPLAVAALQTAGAAWLQRRLAGIAIFPAGAQLTGMLLEIAALIALVGGAATLLAQRRPERRVGTLASLNGALMLVVLATAHGAEPAALQARTTFWAGHLALALAGAGTLARFVPVSWPHAGGAPVLFRRHPWSGILGIYALFSLAGVPGTPGATLWLAAARDLVAAGRTWLLLGLGIAWLAAFSTAAKQLREAVGLHAETEPPPQPVPWQARLALWISGGGLAGVAAIALSQRL